MPLYTGNNLDNIINGGAGNEIFRFDSSLKATTNRDTITDFAPAEERIELENSIFTALTISGPLAASAFVVDSTATTSNHRILYNSLTGTLTCDSNGSDSGGGTIFATLSTGLGASMHAGLFSIT